MFTVEEIRDIVTGDDVIGGSAAVWLHAKKNNKRVNFDTSKSDVDVYTSNPQKLRQKTYTTDQGRAVEYVDKRYLGSRFMPESVFGIDVPSVQLLQKIYNSVREDYAEEKHLYDKAEYNKKIKAIDKKIALLESMADDKENTAENRPTGGRKLRF